MDETVSITSQPVSVSCSEAERHVRSPDDHMTRLKQRLLAPTVESMELSYKPFYAVEVTLTKERPFRGDDTKEGSIFVDAVTGIARARPEGYADLETASVPAPDTVAPDLDEEEALESARRFGVKLRRREKREVDLGDTADLVYKPVWVATLASGNHCVVDATTGEVFTSASFRELLGRRIRSLLDAAPVF